jgi:putative ABC transport system permease protein
MPPFELLFTAIDTIRANKVRAFLTTLGVIIGVLSVILLVALGEGAKQYLSDTFAGLGSNLLQILPGKKETAGGMGGGFPAATTHKLTREDELAIGRRAYSIDAIGGVVLAGGQVRYLNRRRDTFAVGVSARFAEIHNMRTEIGRFVSDEDVEAHRRYVVLGRTILDELYGTENPLGKPLRIADAEFRVIGVMEHKGQSLGFDFDDVVIIPETTSLDLFGLEGYTKFEARARDKASTEAAIADITEILRSRHNNTIDFTVISQDDLLATVNGIMATMTVVLLAIASIGLVVGGIGIANIMLVSVRERTREIGVRRAVGAKRRDILMQFLVEAVVISLLGGLIGLALGAGIISATKLAMPELPVRLSGWIVAVAVGFSAAVGVIAGVEPARRASRLDPVEALRWE